MANPRPPRLLSVDRLSFLLAFVPWLAARGHSSVSEAAAHFGVSEELVRQTVTLVATSGRPGQSRWVDPLPDEMFDIDWDAFDERDELVLTQVIDLAAAPRFSAREAAAVIAGLQYLAGLPESEGSVQIAALHDKLTRAASSAPAALGVASTGVDAALLAQIRSAAAAGVQLEFSYLTEQGSRERRTVDPLRVEAVDDDWYLRGWCHLREGIRTFRLDRITELTVTTTPQAEHPSELALSDTLFSPAGDEHEVVVELPTAALPLLGDFLVDAEVVELDGARARATLRVAHFHAVKRLAARMPGALRVVEPREARTLTREWATAALENYA